MSLEEIVAISLAYVGTYVHGCPRAKRRLSTHRYVRGKMGKLRLMRQS